MNALTELLLSAVHTKCMYIASVGYLAYNYATKPQKLGFSAQELKSILLMDISTTLLTFLFMQTK